MIKCECCGVAGVDLRPVTFESIPEPIHLCEACEAALEHCKTYRYTDTYRCECGAVSTAKGFCSRKMVER